MRSSDLGAGGHTYGAGKAFCAGMDLDELKNLLGKTQDENVKDSSRMASHLPAHL